MRLCCKCFSLWPREAIYCGKCRMPLGVSVLPLSGLASLGALLLLVGAWRWAWHHQCVVVSSLWHVGVWMMGILFAVPPQQVRIAIMQGVTWYGLLWLLSYLLPGGAGRNARQALRTLPRLLCRWLRAALKTLRPLVLLSSRPMKGKGGAAPKDKDKDII